jgi:tellurite resistance-related uncharacterized protein
MHREIAGFHLDEEGDWVAELSCGHPQHTRHNPPFQQREWVLSAAGRAAHIGFELDCLFCNMPALPDAVKAYQQTKTFDEHTVPKGLLTDHSTKAGTWGRILVREGLLLYTIGDESWILRPGLVGIVAPGVVHSVSPQGPVRFTVEFLR